MPKVTLSKKKYKKKVSKVKKEVTKKLEPKLDYLRFRVSNHCRCGGTTEVVIQPDRGGWLECTACATYVRVSYSASMDILQRVL